MKASITFVTLDGKRLLGVESSYIPVFYPDEVIDLEHFDRDNHNHKTVYKLRVVSVKQSIIIQSIIMHNIMVNVEVLDKEVT